MGLASLTAKLISRLDGSMPAARDAGLGSRLGEMEQYGSVSYDYGGGHADKTYTVLTLPIEPIIVITLANADQAANLILPTSKKLYLIINNSGYAITAKVSGQTGITIPNGYRRYAISNGTDIIPFINYMDGVSLNSAILTSPQIINAQASHDYQGAAADWTLSAAEQKVSTLIVTNANGACAIIAPAVAGTRYVVKNTSGQALTIKKTGGTGVTIASTKTAIVEYIGSDYSRITADA